MADRGVAAAAPLSQKRNAQVTSLSRRASQLEEVARNRVLEAPGDLERSFSLVTYVVRRPQEEKRHGAALSILHGLTRE